MINSQNSDGNIGG
jgi:hypothetical protein